MRNRDRIRGKARFRNRDEDMVGNMASVTNRAGVNMPVPTFIPSPALVLTPTPFLTLTHSPFEHYLSPIPKSNLIPHPNLPYPNRQGGGQIVAHQGTRLDKNSILFCTTPAHNRHWIQSPSFLGCRKAHKKASQL